MKSFDELISIMERLRSKNGCAWDMEQTYDSLKPYLIEESYEVIDAIIENDKINLKEELGDLIMLIVFFSQIAKEDNCFTIDDVLTNINEKLVRRHPHVFSTSEVSTTKEILKQWEDIKNVERKENSKEQKSIFDGIPKSLPTISKSFKLMDRASRVGFEYANIDDSINKIKEEFDEVKEAYIENDLNHLEEEIGDFLMTIIDFARMNKIDPDSALAKANKKFIRRFSYIEENARNGNRSLKNMTLDEMDILWNECKEKEK